MTGVLSCWTPGSRTTSSIRHEKAEGEFYERGGVVKENVGRPEPFGRHAPGSAQGSREFRISRTRAH